MRPNAVAALTLLVCVAVLVGASCGSSPDPDRCCEEVGDPEVCCAPVTGIWICGTGGCQKVCDVLLDCEQPGAGPLSEGVDAGED